jgi:hypothetical protein
MEQLPQYQVKVRYALRIGHGAAPPVPGKGTVRTVPRYSSCLHSRTTYRWLWYSRTFAVLLSPTTTPTQMSFSSPPKAQLGRLSAFWTCHTSMIQLYHPACKLERNMSLRFYQVPLGAKIYSTLKMPLNCSGIIVRVLRSVCRTPKQLYSYTCCRIDGQGSNLTCSELYQVKNSVWLVY